MCLQGLNAASNANLAVSALGEIGFLEVAHAILTGKEILIAKEVVTETRPAIENASARNENGVNATLIVSATGTRTDIVRTDIGGIGIETKRIGKGNEKGRRLVLRRNRTHRILLYRLIPRIREIVHRQATHKPMTCLESGGDPSMTT